MQPPPPPPLPTPPNKYQQNKKQPTKKFLNLFHDNVIYDEYYLSRFSAALNCWPDIYVYHFIWCNFRSRALCTVFFLIFVFYMDVRCSQIGTVVCKNAFVLVASGGGMMSSKFKKLHAIIISINRIQNITKETSIKKAKEKCCLLFDLYICYIKNRPPKIALPYAVCTVVSTSHIKISRILWWKLFHIENFFYFWTTFSFNICFRYWTL